MEAFYLTRYGESAKAFERRELKLPPPAENQVLVSVEAFGLNFADVMARMGLYKEAPPLPAILGYEVVGRVEKTGSAAVPFSPGQRVIAFTRFGGYATHALTDFRAVVAIPEDMETGHAAALATQYCTAWYAAEECMRLHAGEHVLVQAAAGGVGTALVQLAKYRDCTVYGTAGSDEKFEYLRRIGVDFPVNYNKEKFDEAIRRIRKGKGVDVVFDSIGGKVFKQGFRLLEPGGKIAGYGAAQRLEKRNIFSLLGLVFGFGFYNPIGLLQPSKSIIGINMLRIADHRPDLLQRCLGEVARLSEAGIFKPQTGAVFAANELAQAHDFLGSRRSTGKIVVKW
ncbi:MAG: alcohol dehydrogenase [Bacteroidetes bacterium]|nr:MAG: alcohol dehydrogenase [Bacteroidota bacterium]